MDQLETLRTGLSFCVHTFGCKVGTYDTGLIEDRLKRFNFENLKSGTLVHVLNTCAVTQEATLEAVRMARRLKRQNPFSLVVATGCAAQVDTDLLVAAPGIDLVVANSHKQQLPELVWRRLRGDLGERVFKSNIFKKEDLEPGGGLESSHTRAFLKIQDGCNSFCTFCVIPFSRGKSRSLSIAALVQRVEELVSSGVKEVVLTGVHIADYQDGPKGLEDLVEALLLKTKILRLRLTSLEPKELSERLLGLFADKRLCRHFHMSIQSASTRVLQAMKRKYNAQDVLESFNQIQDAVPGSFVGVDVIAGFPGESEAEFAESLQNLRQSPWTKLHVFPYSQRPGTAATRFLNQLLPQNVVHERARVLRSLSIDRFAGEAQAQVGQVKQVLGLKTAKALSRDFWPVEIGEGLKANTEALAEITEVRDGILVGHLI